MSGAFLGSARGARRGRETQTVWGHPESVIAWLSPAVTCLPEAGKVHPSVKDGNTYPSAPTLLLKGYPGRVLIPGASGSHTQGCKAAPLGSLPSAWATSKKELSPLSRDRQGPRLWGWLLHQGTAAWKVGREVGGEARCPRSHWVPTAAQWVRIK